MFRRIFFAIFCLLLMQSCSNKKGSDSPGGSNELEAKRKACEDLGSDYRFVVDECVEVDSSQETLGDEDICTPGQCDDALNPVTPITDGTNHVAGLDPVTGLDPFAAQVPLTDPLSFPLPAYDSYLLDQGAGSDWWNTQQLAWGNQVLAHANMAQATRNPHTYIPGDEYLTAGGYSLPKTVVNSYGQAVNHNPNLGQIVNLNVCSPSGTYAQKTRYKELMRCIHNGGGCWCYHKVGCAKAGVNIQGTHGTQTCVAKPYQ